MLATKAALMKQNIVLEETEGIEKGKMTHIPCFSKIPNPMTMPTSIPMVEQENFVECFIAVLMHSTKYVELFFSITKLVYSFISSTKLNFVCQSPHKTS